MSDPPPYSGRNATCPKCATSMSPRSKFMDPKALFPNADSYHHYGGWRSPAHEFMLRTCAVCAFEWVELCADHPTD